MNKSPNQNNNGKKSSKLVHVITFPARILSKARDMYVSTLTTCSSRVAHPYVSCPRPRPRPRCDLLPRSFSVSRPSSRFEGHDDYDDFRELVRAASIRTLLRDNRYILSLRENMPGATEGPGGVLPLPKSSSVIMGRIDEDKAFDETGPEVSFGGLVDGGNMNGVGLRFKSRSFSAGNRSSMF